MTGAAARAAPVAVIAPIHPLVSGAAQFNTAMVTALSELGPVEALSWRRLYPPLIHRRDTHDRVSRPARLRAGRGTLLDWADPGTWRAALRAAAGGGRAGDGAALGASGDGAPVPVPAAARAAASARAS